MKIFPAIDLRNGKAVRLYQGDYDQETVYSDDPVAVARKFREAGARHLHLVDLDGARDGSLANFQTIQAITRAVGEDAGGEGSMFVEVGGGIRDEERIRWYLEAGVSRVILGTIAATEPDFLSDMAGKYGSRIAVGVDARDGKVAIHGWEEVTDLDSFAFCRELVQMGIGAIIYTDIGRDGGLAGTNLEAYRHLQQLIGKERGRTRDGFRSELIASGGISFEGEIEELSAIVDGAILGKALYTGDLDLARCIGMAGPQ